MYPLRRSLSRPFIMLTTPTLAAFQAGAKKAGYTVDDKTTEKITDAGREQFEKYTGYGPP